MTDALPDLSRAQSEFACDPHYRAAASAYSKARRRYDRAVRAGKRDDPVLPFMRTGDPPVRGALWSILLQALLVGLVTWPYFAAVALAPSGGVTWDWYFAFIVFPALHLCVLITSIGLLRLAYRKVQRLRARRASRALSSAVVRLLRASDERSHAVGLGRDRDWMKKENVLRRADQTGVAGHSLRGLLDSACEPFPWVLR